MQLAGIKCLFYSLQISGSSAQDAPEPPICSRTRGGYLCFCLRRATRNISRTFLFLYYSFYEKIKCLFFEFLCVIAPPFTLSASCLTLSWPDWISKSPVRSPVHFPNNCNTSENITSGVISSSRRIHARLRWETCNSCHVACLNIRVLLLHLLWGGNDACCISGLLIYQKPEPPDSCSSGTEPPEIWSSQKISFVFISVL